MSGVPEKTILNICYFQPYDKDLMNDINKARNAKNLSLNIEQIPISYISKIF